MGHSHLTPDAAKSSFDCKFPSTTLHLQTSLFGCAFHIPKGLLKHWSKIYLLQLPFKISFRPHKHLFLPDQLHTHKTIVRLSYRSAWVSQTRLFLYQPFICGDKMLSLHVIPHHSHSVPWDLTRVFSLQPSIIVHFTF